MPLYEYVCPKCKHKEEVICKHSDPNPVCKECAIEMERQLGLSSFILKGEGWYKDGYTKKKENK